MIVSVAPLLRLPRRLDVFDYRYDQPTPFAPGLLAEVRFRGRRTIGIVLAAVARPVRPAETLSPIDRLLSPNPIVGRDLLTAASDISATSFTSLSTTWRSILPAFSARQTIELPVLTPNPPGQKTGHTVTRLTYSNSARLLRHYGRLVQTIRAKGNSILIVSPTIYRAKTIAEQLPSAILLHHQRTPAQYRTSWLAARTAAATVVGTRSAIFASPQRLAAILIDDEDADDHLQEDPSPRYDTRRVALCRARELGIPVILSTRLASLPTSVVKAESQTLDRPSPSSSTMQIDLDAQRQLKDFAIITNPAMEQLDHSPTGRAIIIHPNPGLFRSIICRDCGRSPSCPNCRVPFRVDRSQLVCRHCQITTGVPDRCPACGGPELHGRGRGLSTVATEIRQRFNRVIVEGATDPLPQSPAVRLITPPQLHDVLDGPYDVAVITNYDSLLALPRGDADEIARRTVRTAHGLISTDGTVVIQGHRSGLDRLSIADDHWLANALRERRQFGYPPFWHTLSLRRRNAGRQRSQDPTVVLAHLKRYVPDGVLLGPTRSFGRSSVDRGGTLLTLRFTGQLNPQAKAYLKSLDEAWAISPDRLSTA